MYLLQYPVYYRRGDGLMFEEMKEMIQARKTNAQNSIPEGSRFILMALRKEGPLTLTALEEKFFLFMSQFDFNQSRSRERRYNHNTPFNLTADLEILTRKGLITLEKNTYRLTEEGKHVAEETVRTIEEGAEWIKTHFLNPYAAARNTVFFDFFLALLKLFAGIYGFSTRKGLNDFIGKLLEEDSNLGDDERNTLILAGEIAGDKVPVSENLLRKITDEVLGIFENANYQEKTLWNNCKNVLEHLFDTPIEKYMIEKLRRPRDWKLYINTALHDFVQSRQFGKTRLDRILATI